MKVKALTISAARKKFLRPYLSLRGGRIGDMIANPMKKNVPIKEMNVDPEQYKS